MFLCIVLHSDLSFSYSEYKFLEAETVMYCIVAITTHRPKFS